jgi:hypothetical protein
VAKLGLVERVDWAHVCVGGTAFYEALRDMSEYPWNVSAGGAGGANAASAHIASRTYRPTSHCDFFASGLAAYSSRAEDMGLQFTAPIFRSSVAAMVYVPVQVRCGVASLQAPGKLAWRGLQSDLQRHRSATDAGSCCRRDRAPAAGAVSSVCAIADAAQRLCRCPACGRSSCH